MKETWICHICKKERPDSAISVLTKPLIIGDEQIGQQNIRFCNDNPQCKKEAETYSFVKTKQSEK